MQELLLLLKEIDLEYIKSCELRDLELDIPVGSTYKNNKRGYYTILWNDISDKLRKVSLK